MVSSQYGEVYPTEPPDNNRKPLSKALRYAQRGIPVFPCRPGAKTPVIPKCPVAKAEGLTGKELAEHARSCSRVGHGFLDATTDPRRITAWWTRWPNANVAYPTGKRSGILVVDVDPDKGGYESLSKLFLEGYELPDTTVVESGGGGVHHYYEYPEGEDIRTSTEKLGPGLDVKGEGGYVLAPPSVTKGPYTVLHKRPLVAPPEWLLEALRKPLEPSSGDDGGHSPGPMTLAPVSADLDGPTIKYGSRNPELYRIGCSLRARGLEEAEILAHLERVFEARCDKAPPMEPDELAKIARSAARHAPGNAAPQVSPEVLEALDEIEAELWRQEWPGVGGKSERSFMVTLLKRARHHGTLIPAGVRVTDGIRALALESGLSKRALLDASKKGERRPGVITRLKRKGWLRADNATRSGVEAGAFVLLPPRAEFHHSTTTESTGDTELASGETLRAPRAPFTAPRLRWSRGIYKGLVRVGTIHRLGKTREAIIDHLERADGWISDEELARLLHPDKPPRARDLRRRHLTPMEADDVVECSGGYSRLREDWLDALNRRREQDQELADRERDEERYKRERDVYRVLLLDKEGLTHEQISQQTKLPLERVRQILTRAGRAPAHGETRKHRESYSERRRAAIEVAIAMLFTDRPEYRGRRVGQITCALPPYLPPDFPRRDDGLPKDAEVEAVLDSAEKEAA